MKKDKILHFIVGAMLGTWLIPDASFSLGLGFIGWIICLTVAYLVKELIYDRWLKKGNYEVMDAICTMFVPTVLFIVYIIQSI